MINRLLIRIKTVQLVYACMQNGQPFLQVDDQLMDSIEASQKLCNYLLSLIVKVTDYRRAQFEQSRNKFLPTEEDLNPNTRFTDNRIPEYISNRSEILKYCEDEKLTNDFDTELYRSLLEDIEKLPEYEEYMNKKQVPTFEEDRELWKIILNNVFSSNEKLEEILEEKNIFWNDDFTTILSFIVKIVSSIKPDTEVINTNTNFANETDRKFAVDLYHNCISEYYDHCRLINAVASNWELERMAMMDKIVMSCAMTEIKHFIDIPVGVSINEYIELAKHYCTPNSGRFVNGILDKIVKEWRAEKIIIKK